LNKNERWVFASGNRGKLTEITELLRSAGLGRIELVAQSTLGVEPPPETAPTFVENALLKARHAALATGLPALADDSGIAVDALGGAPGVRSARFAGAGTDDQANVARLLAALEGIPPGARRACFYCVLVALDSATDPAPIIATGRWLGEIALAPRGLSGFGYDPVFLDPVLNATAAELPPEVKNRVSHRGQALRALTVALRDPLSPRSAKGPVMHTRDV
jgi:XTP/dITP diphosphohydrolase